MSSKSSTSKKKDSLVLMILSNLITASRIFLFSSPSSKSVSAIEFNLDTNLGLRFIVA